MTVKTTRDENMNYQDLKHSYSNITTLKSNNNESNNKNDEIKNKVNKPKSRRNRMTLSCTVCRKRKIKVCVQNGNNNYLYIQFYDKIFI